MKNNKKNPRKYIKASSNIFLSTRLTDPWCNMLRTLERRRKYMGVILSDEHTPWEFCYVFIINVVAKYFCLDKEIK